MKKKIMILLIAVSIVVLMFAMVACAGGIKCTGHVWQAYKVVDNGNVQTEICINCGITRRLCYPSPHTIKSFADNGDGTHVAICDKCGIEISEAHTYDSSLTPVQHTALTCVDCGAKFWDDDIHPWTDTNQDNTCDVCVENNDSGENIDCEHNYVGDLTSPANCENDGEMTYTCSLCGDVYTETISATGHSMPEEWTIAEEGGSCYRVCDANDCSHTETHTCDPEINDEDVNNYCDFCGHYICDVIGHIDTDEWHDYRCDRLVDSEGTTCGLSSCGEHQFGPVGPTMHIDGTTTHGHHCQNCGDPIAVRECELEEVRIQPTCTTHGYYGLICRNDGFEIYMDGEFIEPLGHADYDFNGCCDACGKCLNGCSFDGCVCGDEDNCWCETESCSTCGNYFCESDEDHSWYYRHYNFNGTYMHIKYCSTCAFETEMEDCILELTVIPETCSDLAIISYRCVECEYSLWSEYDTNTHPHTGVDENKDCFCDLCGEMIHFNHVEYISCDDSENCRFEEYGNHLHCDYQLGMGYCDICGSEEGDYIDTGRVVFTCQHTNTIYGYSYDKGYHWTQCDACGYKWNFEEHTYGEIKHNQATCMQYYDTHRQCIICGATDRTDLVDYTKMDCKDDDGNHRCDWCDRTTCSYYSKDHDEWVYTCVDNDDDYFCDKCGDSVCELLYGGHNWIMQYNSSYHWYQCAKCGYIDEMLAHESEMIEEFGYCLGARCFIDRCWDCGYVTHFSWFFDDDCCCDNYVDEDGDHYCDECCVVADEQYHDYVYVTTVEPTCVDKGYDLYRCSGCGHERPFEIVPQTFKHNYEVTDTEDYGCEKYEQLTCIVCGNSSGRWVYEHNYDDEGTYHPATCCEYAYTDYVCLDCGDYRTVYNYKEIRPNHAWSEPTLVGYCTYVYIERVCEDCGRSTHESTTTPPPGHNFVCVKSMPATCTQYAYCVYECQNEDCGCRYVEYDYSVKPSGHILDEGTYHPATCNTRGYTIYCCTNIGCDFVLNIRDAGEFEEKDHVMVEFGHVDATCENSAGIKYVCESCSYWYVVNDGNSEPLGHTHEEGAEPVAIVYPGDCKNGYSIYICSRCSEKYNDDFVEGNHSSAELWDSEPATCTEDGYRLYYCCDCDNSWRVVVPNLGGHVDGDGDCVCDNCEESFHLHADDCDCQVLNPTYCNECQVATHSCSACGNAYTEENWNVVGNEHTGDLTYENNYDGTHTPCCSDCGAEMGDTEECIYVAVQWGSTETHEMRCEHCNHWLEDLDHVDNNSDGICDACDQDLSATDDGEFDCDHYDDDEDGECDDCGELCQTTKKKKKHKLL